MGRSCGRRGGRKGQRQSVGLPKAAGSAASPDELRSGGRRDSKLAMSLTRVGSRAYDWQNTSWISKIKRGKVMWTSGFDSGNHPFPGLILDTGASGGFPPWPHTRLAVDSFRLLQARRPISVVSCKCGERVWGSRHETKGYQPERTTEMRNVETRVRGGWIRVGPSGPLRLLPWDSISGAHPISCGLRRQISIQMQGRRIDLVTLLTSLRYCRS